ACKLEPPKFPQYWVGGPHPKGAGTSQRLGNGSAAIADHLSGRGKETLHHGPTGVPGCHYTFLCGAHPSHKLLICA
ncbi:hypothetical protein, partial [Robbsia andropogonis]|uniref:hypothetical protein n=1 Tax=Robbsia andropogonis TaxID=28092 RepID=UPI001F28DBCF